MQIIPDLIDWNTVKLARVELHYLDQANEIDERESFIFRKGAAEASGSSRIRDRTKKSYDWTATFFMADGSQEGAPNPTAPVTDEDSDHRVCPTGRPGP